MRFFVLLASASLALTLNTGCAKPLATVKETRLCLGTVVGITAQGVSKKDIHFAVEEAFKEVASLEAILSKYDTRSDIYSINTSTVKTKPFKVAKESFELIKKSKEFSRISNGAFDITVLPLLELWGFGNKKVITIPTDSEIQSTLHFIGSDKIILDEDNQAISFLHNSMKIDLGGIAKGYIVDKAAEVLKRHGVQNGLVDAGGDLYCFGGNTKNLRWRIGLQHPRNKDKIIARLELKDKAIATSGDYERFIMLEGRRFSHILNPKTGYPVEDIPMSVTIIAGDCMSADALATTVFVLGPAEGLTLLNNTANVSGIIISRAPNGSYDIGLTENLKGTIKFNL
ncbi:MAG: FAD:protein FMN transferase [Candidatus Omnitrophota bacterium]